MSNLIQENNLIEMPGNITQPVSASVVTGFPCEFCCTFYLDSQVTRELDDEVEENVSCPHNHDELESEKAIRISYDEQTFFLLIERNMDYGHSAMEGWEPVEGSA